MCILLILHTVRMHVLKGHSLVAKSQVCSIIKRSKPHDCQVFMLRLTEHQVLNTKQQILPQFVLESEISRENVNIGSI